MLRIINALTANVLKRNIYISFILEWYNGNLSILVNLSLKYYRQMVHV